MTIGHKIKKIRELRNFTQDDLADKLNMSLTGYGKIERDEVDLPYSRLEQISEVFGVKVEELVSFDEKCVFNNYGTANDKSFSIINTRSWITIFFSGFRGFTILCRGNKYVMCFGSNEIVRAPGSVFTFSSTLNSFEDISLTMVIESIKIIIQCFQQHESSNENSFTHQRKN